MKHEWVGPDKVIRWVHCRVCLLIQQIGKPEKPCKGAGKLRPLEKPAMLAAREVKP